MRAAIFHGPKDVGVGDRPDPTIEHPSDADPGLVLDFETDLDGIAEAYAAMDDRRAIKSLVRVGTV